MPEQQTLPMQFGVPLDRSSLLFFGCLIAAIGLVYLSCRQKFNDRITGNGDYVYQLLPRQLATGEEYTKGFMIYFGTMALSVILMSLIGPKNLSALGIPLPAEVGYVVVPLAIAFLWVGILPTVPGLQAVEKYLRQYAHEQAYIPASAQATADRLAASDFDFSAYEGEALQSPEMRGVEQTDFTRSRRSLEHDWARLCCLVYEQKSRRMAGLLRELDADLLRDYAQDLEAIETQKKAMEAEVAAYRVEKAKNAGYINEMLWSSIRNNLRKLYILLGCGVRLKLQPYQDANIPLRQFGFKLNPNPQPHTDDLKLVGIAVIAISVLAVDFAAVVLGQFGLWTLSPPFPKTYYQPFVDTAAILIPFGTAIIAADLMRKRAIKKGWWGAVPRSARTAINGNYLRVAFVCGVVGYAGMLLWGLTLAPLTLAGLQIDAPNTLLAMLTGAFYVFHLDNVETNSRPVRFWEVAGQAILTGIIGLIASAASLDVIFGARAVVDKILLTGAICTMIGFSLGWYIPQVAAAAGVDPRVEAKRERLQSLETAAMERFGDSDATKDWLDTPHPALGNTSPRDAVETVEGYEHAFSLLHGPHGLAA